MLNSKSRLGIALCFALGLTTAASATNYKSTEEFEFGVLADAPGVETTFYTCTACHSERIIAQQGQDWKGWEGILDWMVEDQGMDALDDADRTEILEYLTKNYNEDRPNYPHPIGE